MKGGLHEQISSISDILSKLNKDEALHGKKLAVWQDRVMNALNDVKSMAKSNQIGLEDLQKPILDQLNTIRSENSESVFSECEGFLLTTINRDVFQRIIANGRPIRRFDF